MLALPPVHPVTGWHSTLRLPRDHYVRLNSNDYSVYPAAVGRRVLVRADLGSVQVWCDGGLVADHPRVLGEAPDHLRPRACGRREAVAASLG